MAAFTGKDSGASLFVMKLWPYLVMGLITAPAGAMAGAPRVVAGQWLEPETGRTPADADLIVCEGGPAALRADGIDPAALRYARALRAAAPAPQRPGATDTHGVDGLATMQLINRWRCG